MRIYTELIKSEQPTAVALGFFDGVHLGHRAVLSAAVSCKSEGLVPAAFTFSSTPKSRDNGAQLTTPLQKAELLEKLGIEILYVIDFEIIRDKTPEQFVREILAGIFGAKKVFCGFNYHFGRGGTGDRDMLKGLCSACGIEAKVLEPVKVDGKIASSTEIRNALRSGDIALANKLLGYDFTIRSEVVEGKHLGTAMDTPTVNLCFEEGLIVPRYGVYASLVTFDGRTFPGVTNIGVKPTVSDSDRPNCETWLMLFEGGDLYGKTVEVRLKAFIRPEQKFSGTYELRAAIKRDGETALGLLGE